MLPGWFVVGESFLLATWDLFLCMLGLSGDVGRLSSRLFCARDGDHVRGTDCFGLTGFVAYLSSTLRLDVRSDVRSGVRSAHSVRSVRSTFSVFSATSVYSVLSVYSVCPACSAFSVCSAGIQHVQCIQHIQ